jgi:DNA polymerase III alpha subunit (gram-positive type)
MAISDNNRVFLDLEYLYPEMTAESGRPTSDKLRQIVQIAAIKFSESNQQLDELDILVHPTYTKTLPDFFSELTGIVQADLERGHGLYESLDVLEAFVANCPGRVYCFDKDYEVLVQNAGYINRGLTLPKFIQVKQLLPKWGIDPDGCSSGTLHQLVGVSLAGKPHNALFDVKSMASAVFSLEHNSLGLRTMGLHGDGSWRRFQQFQFSTCASFLKNWMRRHIFE